MKKPEKPLPTDCCGSGCERCVYEIYIDRLRQYHAWKEQREHGKTEE